MRKEDCFYLGCIVKKYSFKGEIVIKLDTDEPAKSYMDLQSVFIAIDKGSSKRLAPFFIEKIRLYKNTSLRVKFKNINSEIEADAILQLGIYLPLSLLPPLTGNQFYYHEIIGFSITDIEKGLVGKVKGVDDRTSQALFEVQDVKNNLILIPMVDDFILKVDRKSKNITVKTPKELLELYQ